MCDPISATIGAAVIGGGISWLNGKKQASQQKAAQASAESTAAQNSQRAEEQFNKMNQKMPGVASIIAKNKIGAGKGIGSTFLTGAAGVPTGTLPLGGGSLLGS